MAGNPSASTVRSRLTAAVRRLAAAVAARVSVDLRALAAFRIGLGALVIADLLLRSRSLTAFYTDYGVLPRRAFFSDYSGNYSLHALSGEPWAVGLLFALAGAFALALVVGYRTRLVTLVSWVLLVSLHARNPMVLNSGDTLLRMLLFWSAASTDWTGRRRSRAGETASNPWRRPVSRPARRSPDRRRRSVSVTSAVATSPRTSPADASSSRRSSPTSSSC